MLLDYISHFMWLQKHKGPDVFYHFWQMASSIYPVEERSPPQSEGSDEDNDAAVNDPNAIENLVENNRRSFERVYVEDW